MSIGILVLAFLMFIGCIISVILLGVYYTRDAKTELEMKQLDKNKQTSLYLTIGFFVMFCIFILIAGNYKDIRIMISEI